METHDVAWHSLPASEVAARLDTDPAQGLSNDEARARREKHGPNALPPPARPSVLKQILAQFLNPLVGTLLVAAGIAVAVAIKGHEGGSGLARFGDAIAILTIVLVNAFIGFYQERKAEKALDALMKLGAARCRVRRHGEAHDVDARVLVPGDVVLLEAGDRVPADLRLVTTTELQTVEGELTGESAPVEKDAARALEAATAIADRATMAFSGTTAVHGDAVGVVVATGQKTQVGRVGKLLAEVQKQKSPLEERLDRFGTQILWVTLGLSAALFALGALRGEVAWHVLLLTAVSLAVAVIPEGLPAITSITLALGMQRMAHRGSVVRKLAAVETLGCATVICTDKTGTLTRNEMTVRLVAVHGHEVEVTGQGFGGEGELREGGERLAEVPESLRRLVAAGALANTAAVKKAEGEDGPKATGDPTEVALVALSEKAQLPRRTLMERCEHALTIPFNSERKRMTVVMRYRGGGETRLAAQVKGAVDVLLPRCERVRTDDGVVELDDEGRRRLAEQAERYSSRALRVLAMAEREGGEELLDREVAESGLTFLGMVGIIDPPRPEVKEAVAAAKSAGIKVVMITGDHPVTARAIAEELGLWGEGDRALTGDDLRAMSDDALAEALPSVRVFARVDPEHKLRIVQLFQERRNEVVAMTGDGVNDAPAIKQAAIGVAMGKGGTDVAREAADMVLQDDNFATIVEAVREGRAIYRNIQKSIFFLLSSNAGLCMAVFAAGFFPRGEVPPLTALQLLWINLVTNGLPALALGVDPPESGQMREPPRHPDAPILGREDWMGLLGVGALMASSAMLIYWLPLWPGLPEAEVRSSKLTMVFTLLAFAPLAHAFNCRSRTASIFKLGFLSNKLLVGAVMVSATIHMVSLVVPALQPVFRTNHVWDWREAAVVLGLALVPIPVAEFFKAVGWPVARGGARSLRPERRPS